MKCKAKTKAGTRCKFNAQTGSNFCHVHKPHRPTDAELEIRKLKVSEMLIEGKSKHEMWRYASDKWGVSQRTLDRYISDCTKQIKESAETIRSQQLALAIEQLRDLYDKNYMEGNYKECRLIINAKLDLLSNPTPGKKKSFENENNIRPLHSTKNF